MITKYIWWSFCLLLLHNSTDWGYEFTVIDNVNQYCTLCEWCKQKSRIVTHFSILARPIPSHTWFWDSLGDIIDNSCFSTQYQTLSAKNIIEQRQTEIFQSSIHGCGKGGGRGAIMNSDERAKGGEICNKFCHKMYSSIAKYKKCLPAVGFLIYITIIREKYGKNYWKSIKFSAGIYNVIIPACETS